MKITSRLLIGAFISAIGALVVLASPGTSQVLQKPGACIYASPGPTATGSGQILSIRCDKNGNTVANAVPAALMTPVALSTGTAFVALSSAAVPRVSGIWVTWASPTTATVCYVSAYNSATPTLGTAIVLGPFVITTSAPGTFFAFNSPLGTNAFTAGLSVAVTTTPTGSAACNAVTNALFIGGAQ